MKLLLYTNDSGHLLANNFLDVHIFSSKNLSLNFDKHNINVTQKITCKHDAK